MKKQEGITLVALIITIIILLILATVSISLIINSGIIDHAQQGADRYSEEEKLEQIKLAVASAQLKENGFLTTENLNSELQSKFNNEENATETPNFWYYKGNRIYKDGKIEEGKLLPDEYQQLEYIESSGTQYIDTGLLSKNYSDICCEIKGKYTKISSAKTIFGAGGGSSNTWYLIGVLYGTSDFGAQKGTGGTEKKFCSADLNEHVFTIDLRKCNCLSRL